MFVYLCLRMYLLLFFLNYIYIILSPGRSDSEIRRDNQRDAGPIQVEGGQDKAALPQRRRPEPEGL
jgi:hypothetical protein